MKKYQVIYADPPWEVKRGPDWNSNGTSKPLPYTTMTVDSIKNLPIKNLADKNSYLFLWVINKYIPQAYEIASEWGFSPSCLLTWCKPRHGIGIGGTFVQTTEHLLFARRGTKTALKRIDATWFSHKRLSHSEKPDMFRQLIEEVGGNCNKLELFARQKIRDWDVWGNEIENSISLNQHEWDQVITKHGYPADEVISALQKSIRRGEEEDAVFFAYEMMVSSDELSDKFWQRVRVISVEDVGLANPDLAPTINALYENYQSLKGKGDAFLQGLFATVLLTRSPKSRYIDELFNNLREKIERENYRRDVPDYALDKHTRKGEAMGRDDLHFWQEASKLKDDISNGKKQNL